MKVKPSWTPGFICKKKGTHNYVNSTEITTGLALPGRDFVQLVRSYPCKGSNSIEEQRSARNSPTKSSFTLPSNSDSHYDRKEYENNGGYGYTCLLSTVQSFTAVGFTDTHFSCIPRAQLWFFYYVAASTVVQCLKLLVKYWNTSSF